MLNVPYINAIKTTEKKKTTASVKAPLQMATSVTLFIIYLTSYFSQICTTDFFNFLTVCRSGVIVEVKQNSATKEAELNFIHPL